MELANGPHENARDKTKRNQTMERAKLFQKMVTETANLNNN